MAAKITRLLTISYGGFSVGGASNYHIDGPIEFDKDYETFRVACDVVIVMESGDNEALFQSVCESVEDNFREVNVAVVVNYGGSTHLVADPSTNTGFNTRANFRKTGDETTDTGRSRRYRLEINGELPADQSGDNGLQSSSTRIFLDDSQIETVEISGVYTALGPNDAKAQHDAQIGPLTVGILAGLTGTYELLPNETTADKEDKIVNFRRVFKRIVVNQAAATLDHPAIKRQIITVSTRSIAPGDSPIGTPIVGDVGAPMYQDGEVRRPIEIELSAVMSVDINETQALKDLWTGTVRPHLIATAFTLAGAGFAAIIEITPTFDPSNNTLSATLRAIATQASVLESVLTVNYRDQKGRILQGFHSSETLTKKRYDAERKIVRTVTQIVRILKGTRGGGLGGAGAGGGGGGGGGGNVGGFGARAGAPGSAFLIGGIPAIGFIPKVGGRFGTGFGIGAGPPGSAFEFGGVPLGGPIGGSGGRKPFVAQPLNDIAIAPLDVPGGAIWDRVEETQEARPERKGIEGFQIETVVLQIQVIDELYVPLPSGGRGGGPEPSVADRN